MVLSIWRCSEKVVQIWCGFCGAGVEDVLIVDVCDHHVAVGKVAALLWDEFAQWPLGFISGLILVR